MANITSLGFNLSSKWDGKGVQGATDDLTKLKAALESITGTTATVTVDDEQAKTSIDDLKAGLELLGETHATATADVDAQAEALDMLKADLDQFAEEHKTATADVDAQKAALDELKADLDKFAQERATATANVDTEGQSTLDELMTKLVAFGMMHETAKADVDTDAARSGLSGLTQDSETAARGLSDVGGAAGGASGGLNSTGSAAAGAGGNMNFFLAALAVAIALLVALLPALGGIITGLIGMGAAFGVAYLAIKPVISALQDFSAAQQSAGQTSAQQAAQAQANATAIASAQQSIIQAQQQAAQTQITGAMQVEAAQQNLKQSYMSLADAQRQQAFQAQQSANSLVSAEQAVTNAQIADANAVRNLTQARIDAKNAMDNLNNSVADGVLSVRSAQLQLQQAQLNQANLGPNATVLQQEQAQLAVDQAKQSIIDQQTRLGQLQQQQAAAQKAGIDGSSQVLAATNAVRIADENVLNTERALQMARLTAANSAVSASQAVIRAQDNVAQSQLSLQRAQEQASFANQQAAQRVVQAQQAYNNLIVQQRLQSAATAAASPYGKYQQDLANLTPAARNLLNLLTQSGGILKQISQTAQNAFLPGVTTFLKDAISSLPTFNNLINIFGSGFGRWLGLLGDWAASPMAQGQFNQIISAAAQFMQELGDATLQFAPAFSAFLAASGPATQAFADGLGTIIGTGLPDMFKALTPYVSSGSQFLSQFLGLLSDLLPIIGQVGGIMTEVLAPALGPLRQLIQALANALLPALQALAPAVGQLAGQWISSLTPVIQAIAPILKDAAIGISEILGWIRPLIPILAPLATGLWLVNAAMNANPAIAIASAIAILVGGIVYLATKTQFFQTVWRDVWNAVKRGWDDFIGAFKTAWDVSWKWVEDTVTTRWDKLRAGWNQFIADVKRYWDDFIGAFKTAWDDSWGWVRDTAESIWNRITGAWNGFTGGIKSGVQDLVNGVRAIWNGIVDVFKDPINAVINIWNTVGGFFGLPHVNNIGGGGVTASAGGAVGNAIGAGAKGAKLATGGYISGPGSGTSDSIPAWVSNGEYIMPANVVQHYGLDAMESMRAKKAPRFLLGGLVEVETWLANGINSTLHFGLNSLKKSAFQDIYDGSKALMDKVVSLVPHPIAGMGEPAGDFVYDAMKTVEDDILSIFQQKTSAGDYGSSLAKGVGAIATNAHKQIIDAALKAAGVPSDQWGAWEAGLNVLITRESSWNPNAQNNSDINAINGDPSRGLAQVIMSTFNAYHVAGTSSNIFDPVANVAAAIRYILARYGGIQNVQQANPNLPPKGYAIGTTSAARGWAIVGERGPEAVHFGGGESVKSFPDTMAAIGAGASNMKALINAIAEQGDGGDVHIEMPVTIYAGNQTTADEIAQEFENDVIPKLTMLIKQGVGKKNG